MDKDTKYDEMRKWAEQVPVEELYSEIRKLTGLSDLSFTTKIDEDRYGRPRIQFSTQDLVDKVGFLKLLFSYIDISTFNTEIKYNEERDIFYWWGSAHFSYKHPSGGSNGHAFLTFWYDGNWQFENR